VSRRGGGYNPGMDAEYAALLRLVLADPAADAPRLVLADWLDGRGGRARAEFVRVQCALEGHCAGQPQTHGCNTDRRIGADGEIEGLAHLGRCRRCDWLRANAALRRRERELLAARGDDWAAADLGPGLAWQAVAAPRWAFASHSACHYRRGFVDWVGCSWRVWQAHAPALRRAAPLTRVTLTTPAPTLAVLERAYPGIAFGLPPAAEFPTDSAALERIAAIPPAG
jgi:uncharacterized protein (TIGR02996 family)